MTAPITPTEVEAELARLADRLEHKSDELAGLLEAAAKADVAFRLAHARAELKATRSRTGKQSRPLPSLMSSQHARPPRPSPRAARSASEACATS